MSGKSWFFIRILSSRNRRRNIDWAYNYLRTGFTVEGMQNNYTKEGIPMETVKKRKTGKLLIVLIVLAVLLPAAAAACVMVTADTYNETPEARIISILPHSSLPGEEVAFKGRGIDPDGYIKEYSWRSDLDGDLSDQAGFRTASLTEGEHTIYFKVKDSSNEWSGEVTERVRIGTGAVPPANNGAPVIVTFKAEPAGIQSGDTAVLAWKVSSAAAVTISGGIGNVPLEGSKAVSPAATTSYTLTATKGNDTVTANTVLHVGAAPQNQGQPVIHYFKANPLTVNAGDPSLLSWKVSGATSVVIDHGIGSVAPTGMQSVTPQVMTTYKLKATNPDGWVAQTMTVAVAAGAPDNTPPSVPVLLSPAANAVLPQPSSPWNFDWADSADPESGIKQYQIFVKLNTMPNALVDDMVAGSQYTENGGGSIPQANCQGWTWKVRAQNNAGLWSQWSQPRGFSVQPPAAASTTVVVTAVSAEGGYVADDGTVFNGAMIAGDDVNDKSYQAFVSFDISAIPAGATIQDVVVDFDGQHVVFGDPFNDLGCLRAYVDDYSVLDAGDYFIGAPLGAVLRYCTEAELTPPASDSDVKNEMQARLGHSRFQMRIHYNETATDGDGQADCMLWLLSGLPELTVTYTQ